MSHLESDSSHDNAAAAAASSKIPVKVAFLRYLNWGLALLKYIWLSGPSVQYKIFLKYLLCPTYLNLFFDTKAVLILNKSDKFTLIESSVSTSGISYTDLRYSSLQYSNPGIASTGSKSIHTVYSLAEDNEASPSLSFCCFIKNSLY